MNAAPSLVGVLALLAAALPGLGQAASATRPAAVALPGTAEGGWREYRGDPRNLGVCHGPAPSFKGPRWKFVADSGIRNSPAVDAGAVVFASRSGRLYAVRTTDGSKIWEKPLSAPPDEKAPHSGFTYSSPLIRDGRVTIGSEDGHVSCVSLATGDLLWRRHLGGTGAQARIWASPKTNGALVFVGSNSGFFWALDPASGEPRWKAHLGEEVGSSAAILGSEVFVASRDKKLYVFDAASGEPRWNAELGGATLSSPALHLGFAFLRASGGKVLAVDLVSRGVQWTVELSSSMYPNTSLCAEGDRVYATSASALTAFDAATGDQAWEMRARVAFDASPLLVGDWVVAAGADQILYVVDKKTGAKVKELRLSEKLLATPAIVDGIAYVPGDAGTLFAIE
jgi:eukaryotic-like serine/threonine-protein kinase